MLDNFFERLRATDAFKDYFDELTQIVEKVINKVIGYNWQGLGKHFG